MKQPHELTILIVDDEEVLRQVISSSLQRKGFKIISASSGRLALEEFKNQPVDLVLSDIRMPDGDGMFLLKELRKLDPKNPPIVFMTGFSDVETDEFLSNGALKVIPKPFGRLQLLELVNEVLAD